MGTKECPQKDKYKDFRYCYLCGNTYSVHKMASNIERSLRDVC